MIRQIFASVRGRKLLIGASLLILFAVSATLAAQAETFPRCISGCTANDVELDKVTAELLGPGVPGGSVEANLLVSLHFNRQKTYCVRFVADVYIDGKLAISDMASEPINVFQKGDYPSLYFGTVSLPYGSSLSLENILVMWSVDKDFEEVTDCVDGSCEPYGPRSKCTGDQYGTISVIVPLEALDDAVGADEDERITIDALANDILGLEPTRIVELTHGAHGSTANNGDGTINYTPEANFSGIDSFTYTIQDSEGNSATARVTVTIISQNDAPIAFDDDALTDENVTVQIDILENDIDSDGTINPAAITVTKSPGNGEVSINSVSGIITYTPDPGTCGDDYFKYTVKDNEGTVSNEAKVELSIVCNQDPVARDDVATTEEGLDIDIDILANDFDSDGSINPATVIITKDATDGTIRVDPSTGIVSYSPDQNACGNDSFKYTVADNDGGISAEAKVELTILCNEPPVARDDVVSTDENRSVNIDILANDADQDGTINPSTVTITKDPKDGSISVDPSTGVVSYVPDPGSCGDDSFKYTVNDDDGAVSNEALVKISVVCNEPPVAEDDEATTDENTSVGIHVASNDFDPDGMIDPTTIVITQQPGDGSVRVHPTSGVVTYTPNTGECDEDVFKYIVRDNDGRESNEATVTVEILCDDPPLAIDDLYSVGEGQILNVSSPGVLGNDITSPEHPVSVTLGSGVSHGTLSLNADGSFRYAHDGSETTSDEFTYVVSGGTKESNVATVTLIIQPGNDSPAARDDQGATDEDVPVTLSVLANDSDPDGDILSVDWVDKPENGTVSNNGRTVTYTPNPNFYGTDTFEYAATDGNGGQAQATVTIVVSPVNDAPMAQDDSQSSEEDTPVTVLVLLNDSDPDGDNLSIQSVDQPSHGVSAIDGSSVTYSPDPDFHGIDTFSYTLSDGRGGTSVAIVTIAVAEVNDPPKATDDLATTPEDVSVNIGVLANDSDPDGDGLTVESVAQPLHGTVTNNGTGLTYAPNADFYGEDEFTYTVRDGNGGKATATVKVAVTPSNDPPVAQDDNGSTIEDVPVLIGVLANDSDPDGDALILQSATQPTHGTTSINASQVLYTPNRDFNGPDSFTYIVSDGRGGSATAEVTVIVIARNDAPVAEDDDASTDEETPISISVLVNDSDPDGDSLLIQAVTQPGHGVVESFGATLTYTPNANFNGIDTLTYTISDGSGGTATATVTVQVDPTNDAPIAQSDSAITEEDTLVLIPVLANDSDPDGDFLFVASTTSPANGSVIPTQTNVSYIPNPGFNGIDSFTYTISDGQGGSATATVSIAVAAVNDPPVAQDDSRATDEDTSVIVEVLANDSDPDGDGIIIQSVTQPAHGSTVGSGETIAYTPDPQFHGVDTFTYTISDGNGGTATATVTIAVTAVNDPPIAQNDSDSTDEGSLAVIDVLANDFDPDGDELVVLSVTQPAHGSAVNNGLDVSYTPDSEFNGVDSFTYAISDGHGGTATATVTVAVAAVNDPPVALNDSANTSEDTPVSIAVLTNDTDPDGDDLAIQSVTQPAHGLVTHAAGIIVYTPNPQFNGSDTFTYTMTDGHGASATATVTVSVNAVNDAPTAQDDSGSTNEGTAVSLNVLQNDSDPDGDGLTIESSTQADHGSVVHNGTSITYTPNPGYNGIDSFVYTISDSNGETASATVVVAVAAVNENPTALDDTVETGEDQTATVLVLPNDSDPDSDPLVIQSVTQPAHGTVVSNGTSIIYTPAPNYVGIDSFTYTISDGHGGVATASVSVNVLPVNDGPIAQDDSQMTQENTSVTVLVLSNDSDPDGDTLIVESTQQPANGRVTNTGTTLVYVPNAGFGGTDGFIYTVADQKGGKDTARVTIVVSTRNDPPIAQNDSASTNEEVLVLIPILANDSDPDGDFLLIESYTQPANGTVINSRTNLSYIPNPGFQGIDTFTYTVSDGNGGSSQATVTVSVAEVNEIPFAQDDSAITDEGDATTILPLLNDSDPDGDPLAIESVTSPDHGSVELVNGQIVYTPDPGFDGVDTFTYTISDARGGTSTATVFVAVAPVNDAPIAQNDSITTIQEAIVSIPVLANDDDPDGDPISIVTVTQPANGTVVIGNGEILYEPAVGFSGTDTFGYTIADDHGRTSTAIVTIGVDPLVAGAGAAANDAASCEGRVIISEIAWAGTAADARDEWIELRNLGTTPVDLTGWMIRWRSTLPSAPEDQIWKVIELEGTLSGAATAACDLATIQDATAQVTVESLSRTTWLISADANLTRNGYYVLERRSNSTIKDLQANQIYDIERTLSLGLSDLGEIVMLVNPNEEVVDTANASNLGRNGWVAGSTTTKGSMERIDPLKPDSADNWQTNFGLVIAGDDSADHPLRATPGLTNSPDLGMIQAIVSVSPASVRAGEVLHTDFSLTRQDRRAAGWPWISVIRPGFTGSSGAGGAVDYTAYAFSGSYQSDTQYALEIGTSSLSTGAYSFWIIYGEGKAVYIPVVVSP